MTDSSEATMTERRTDAPDGDAGLSALIDAISNYQQADEDGVMVLVSRQACDEAAIVILREVERRREAEAKLGQPCQKIFDHKWLDPRCVEYGCQSIKPGISNTCSWCGSPCAPGNRCHNCGNYEIDKHKISIYLERAERAEAENARLRDGARPLPYGRDELGAMVREAWIRWAQQQPSPKPSWLVPYDGLSEADKEADRQIGETIARWILVGDACREALASPQPDAIERHSANAATSMEMTDVSAALTRARREGAEAMREAAACDVEQYGVVLEKRERDANSGHGRAVEGTTWAFSHRIRALPLPGDEPKVGTSI